MKKMLHLTFLLGFITMFSCGGDVENKNSADIEDSGSREETTTENRATISGFSWDNIPIYPGAALDEETDCPAKWADCKICQHRVYITYDSPNEVCDFYGKEMPKMGWEKIVFQNFPEGSCMGSWKSSASDIRVFFNAAKRRSDKKTFIAFTMGKDCPE